MCSQICPRGDLLSIKYNPNCFLCQIVCLKGEYLYVAYKSTLASDSDMAVRFDGRWVAWGWIDRDPIMIDDSH